MRYIGKKGDHPLDWSSMDFSEGRYNFTKLDYADIEKIRVWRNEQIDVLRQDEAISKEEQIRWFEDSVIPSIDSKNPDFILFSYLFDDMLIGYGGLTNISWKNNRAEVSFLLSTERTTNIEEYANEMGIFLGLLKRASAELGILRLYTETYSFRESHIQILENNNFKLEGCLKNHIVYGSSYADSIIHGWINNG